MKTIGYAKTAVAAAIAAVSFGASAMTFEIGDVDASFFLTQPVVKAAGTGAFVDYFTFTIVEPSYSFGALTNMVTGPNFLNITGMSVQLYAGAIGSGILIDDLADNPGSIPGSHFAGAGYYPITVGSTTYYDYYFQVAGNASGTGGGAYVFSATTAPVPEPETYAMLMAGLGVMGAIAVRRKKAKQD